MTRAELMKACEMRADGYTYQEIADDLGYTKQNVQQIMVNLLRNDGYQISPTTIYPNLEREIKVKHKKILNFSKSTGIKSGRVHAILSGKVKVLLDEALWYREYFDKDIDYLFEKRAKKVN